MKASYSWVRAHLEGEPLDASQMAEELTRTGTEVEDVDPAGEDFVLDVGVTSNRPDCLCHLGLAREVAAATGATVVEPRYELRREGEGEPPRVQVEVSDAVGCPRYCALVIEGVRVAPSPAWMRERLEAIGVRPVNNVVDATNYVLFELNQPLHAFDLDRLRGGRIAVRRARAKESFQALNEKSYELREQDLVIADEERAVALAGVMGGLDSEVGDATTRVLLEAACFDPVSVRKTSRRLGLSSDSSFRFERGIDRGRVLEAGRRAAALITEVAGGRVLVEEHDVGGPGPGQEPVTLRFERVAKVCGLEVEPARCEGILRTLGLEVLERSERAITVRPPTFRHDLTREIDLVEEVIRLVGLDEIPLEGGMRARIPRLAPAWALRDRVKDHLVQERFLECITPAFVADGPPGACAFLAEGQGEALAVRNPVRAEEPLLRRSLVPSLLQVRKLNHDQGNTNVRLFEVSALHLARGAGEVPRHLRALGGLLDGDLRDARGVLENLAARSGVALTFARHETALLAPGEQARVEVEGTFAGVLGVPSKALREAFLLKIEPVVFELDLEVWERAARPVKTARPLPRFPASDRDLSLNVAERVTWGELESTIRGVGIEELESIRFFDLYRGKQIGEDRKSLALTMTFRRPDRTLTSEEVDGYVARILADVRGKLGAEQRGA